MLAQGGCIFFRHSRSNSRPRHHQVPAPCFKVTICCFSVRLAGGSLAGSTPGIEKLNQKYFSTTATNPAGIVAHSASALLLLLGRPWLQLPRGSASARN